MTGLAERRYQRADRLSRLRSRAIAAARTQRIFCIEPSDIAVPAWARERQIQGLSNGADRVWLRRPDAELLMRLDREVGGNPGVMEAQYRRCPVCDRPLLGEDAEARRILDESAKTARQRPCGSECLDAAKDMRWRGEPR